MWVKKQRTLFPQARVIVEQGNGWRVWSASDRRYFIDKVQKIAGVRQQFEAGNHHVGLLAQFKAPDGEIYPLDTIDGCVRYLRSINQHVWIYTFENCLEALDRDTFNSKCRPEWPSPVMDRIQAEMRQMMWVSWV